MHANLAAKMATLAQQPFRATTRDGKILELVDRRAVAFERLAPFLRAAQQPWPWRRGPIRGSLTVRANRRQSDFGLDADGY